MMVKSKKKILVFSHKSLCVTNRMSNMRLIFVCVFFYLGGCSTAHCQPPHDDTECCTPECPCQEGEGDCDEDADCAAGLFCAQHEESPAWCQVGLSGDCCARIPTTGNFLVPLKGTKSNFNPVHVEQCFLFFKQS